MYYAYGFEGKHAESARLGHQGDSKARAESATPPKASHKRNLRSVKVADSSGKSSAMALTRFNFQNAYARLLPGESSEVSGELWRLF